MATTFPFPYQDTHSTPYYANPNKSNQVSDHKKSTSSTSGMGTSVQTSDLLAFRAAHVVPKRMDAIIKAIADKDFETFGRITMQVCARKCCILSAPGAWEFASGASAVA